MKLGMPRRAPSCTCPQKGSENKPIGCSATGLLGRWPNGEYVGLLLGPNPEAREETGPLNSPASGNTLAAHGTNQLATTQAFRARVCIGEGRC